MMITMTNSIKLNNNNKYNKIHNITTTITTTTNTNDEVFFHQIKIIIRCVNYIFFIKKKTVIAHNKKEVKSFTILGFSKYCL